MILLVKRSRSLSTGVLGGVAQSGFQSVSRGEIDNGIGAVQLTTPAGLCQDTMLLSGDMQRFRHHSSTSEPARRL